MAGKTLHCCLFCGRDTTARSMICSRCLGKTGGVAPGTRMPEHGAHATEQPWADVLDADDFGDSAGPDDVHREPDAVPEEGYYRGEGR